MTTRPGFAPVRAELIAGVAAAALLAGQAFAQTPADAAATDSATAPAASATPVIDDGLGQEGFYLEADEVIQDDAGHTVTARGGVEARYRGRVLRAESVVYNIETGVVEAQGAVRILNADGTMQAAERVMLDRDFTAGFALGFSTRLSGNAQIAAASVVRRSPTVDEMNRVIYTPCEVCADEAEQTGRPPTWAIRARQVVRDRDRQIIYYRDAVVEVLGVPALYLPVFWHADPAVERKSGFLAPVVGGSRIRGLSYEQPYLHVISPSEDVVFRLQINQNANPFAKVDWRRRFYTGYAEARVGYTYNRDLDNNGNRFGDLTSRSYILSRGEFQISPAWRWGFTAERASENLIFDKYDVSDVYLPRGPYAVDDRRLISQVWAARQTPNSYFSAAALSVQGLRSTDEDATFPLVAPLIEARWEPTGPVMGGRLRVRGSAVFLNRDTSQFNLALPGVDSARGTAELDWRRAITLSNGIRIEPFLLARGDVYAIRDLPGPEDSATLTRGFGVAGVDLSWPFFRRQNGVTVVLEPIVQLAAGNRAELDPRIPNEDSEIFEFDSTNLFQINRSPGFDLYEGGNRLNVGGRATVTLDSGPSGNILVGRSYRSTFDPTIPTRTGLADTASDWIVAAEITPVRNVSLFARARLDDDGLNINRLEAGADFSVRRASGFVRYLREDVSPTGDPVEDLDFRGEVFITSHWGVSLYGVRDLEAGAWRQRDLGLIYEDECTRVEVIYRHNETFNRTIGPSESVVVRLTLATLGNSGYRRR